MKNGRKFLYFVEIIKSSVFSNKANISREGVKANKVSLFTNQTMIKTSPRMVELEVVWIGSSLLYWLVALGCMGCYDENRVLY